MMFVPARREVRGPVIKMDGERIIMREHIKYLGIYVDRKRNWVTHVKKMRARVTELGGKFYAMGRRKWGKGRDVMKCMFERVICPMALYGCEVWGERVGTFIKRHLRATERPFLRAITGAYRTAPTAALSVLSGCVPLEARAAARYETHREWGREVRKVNANERVGTTWRGYMPGIDEEERMRSVRVWTDASVKEGGMKAVAWVGVGVRGEVVKGGGRVTGEIGSTEIEGYGVWKGIEAGLRMRTGNEVIRVMTDSKQVVEQLRKGDNRWKYINNIQREIERGMEGGQKIVIEWRDRKVDGIKLAHRECNRIIREGGIELRIEGVTKNFVKKKKRMREEEIWQSLWNEGMTGRWLKGMWENVNREGSRGGRELVQMATGHGNFKGYLRRFGLGEDGQDGMCECGGGLEDVEHVTMHCRLPWRVTARRGIENFLGHYPPRLDRLTAEGWTEVNNWAIKMVGEQEG